MNIRNTILATDTNISGIAHLFLIHNEGNSYSGQFTATDSAEYFFKAIYDGEMIQVTWKGIEDTRQFQW